MARKSRKAGSVIDNSHIVGDIVYKTAIYVRLSVMDSGKKDGESIINQRDMLERYIVEHPELVPSGVFVDNGETGVDFLRPAWNDLMRECRAGKINCIMIKDLSRLGRNYIETGEYLDKIFPLLGIRLIAVNDGYDGLNLTNGERLVSNLKNLVNDIYAKDISRKSSAALRIKQKQGAFIGTYASYGYLKDPTNKNKIIVDPETAPVVRQIFAWKADGVGSAHICRKLGEAGIPAPNKYRFQKGIVKDKRYARSEWAPPVLRQIIKNQVYLGHMVQGRKRGALYEGGGHAMISEADWTVVENTHEPIISKDLYNRANTIISNRTAEYKKKQGVNTRIQAPEMLLKGLLFCADCGRPLFRNKKVKGKRVYWTYQCRSHNTLMTCPYKYIHEEDLYNAVYAAIRIEIQKSADVGLVIDKLNKESGHKTRLSKYDAEIEEAERELRRLTSLRQAVYDDYAAKILTVSEYQYASEKYNIDFQKQKERLDRAKQEKQDYTRNSTPENKWLSAFGRFMNNKELTVEMAQTLISRIEVSNRDRVSVTFNFRDELEAISAVIQENKLTGAAL